MALEEYEISIWEKVYNGGYYVDQKIAVIGADTFDGPNRAYHISFNENVNGTHTLKFSMVLKCLDNATGETYANPFIDYLVNERPVKVKWKKEWYDLVVKNCQEDSSNRTVTYTCTDEYINELSKTGFNLEFDDQKQNNQGSAEELGARVMDGTDWRVLNVEKKVLKVNGNMVEPTGSALTVGFTPTTVYQRHEEAVFEVTLTGSLNAVDDETSTSATIASGKKVLLFYDQFADLTNGLQAVAVTMPIQFAYADTYETVTHTQLVTNARSYSTAATYAVVFAPSSGSVTISSFPISGSGFNFNTGVSPNYRAKRIVKKQVSVMDSVTKKYCDVYKDSNNNIVYRYIDTKVETANAVVNIIANASNFSSMDSWVFSSQNTRLKLDLYPKITDSSVQTLSTYKGAPCIYWPYEQDNLIKNNGIVANSIYLPDGLQNGAKYVFRYKARVDSSGEPGNVTTSASVGCAIKTPTGNSILTAGSSGVSGDWCYQFYEVNTSVAYNELVDYAFYFTITSGVWIEAIQFFKYVKNVQAEIDWSQGNISNTGADSGSSTQYIRSSYVAVADAPLVKCAADYVSQVYGYYKGTGSSYTYKGRYNIATNKFETGSTVPTWNTDQTQLTLQSSSSNVDDVDYVRFVMGNLDDWEGGVPTKATTTIATTAGDNLTVTTSDFLLPDQFETLTLAQKYYNYYNHTFYPNGTDSKDIQYIYQGTEEINLQTYGLTPYMNTSNEKIRSISESESNRFNLLQTIAEQFDCWVNFEIEHNEDGTIKFDSDGPRKFVYFTETLGQETGIGFVYGIDLNTVRRTIQSDQIVTKTIVVPNNNEFAPAGSCNIGRAANNYSRSTSIYNFDYYITQGLLDATQLTNDLYNTSGIGYYTNLHNYYSIYDNTVETWSNLMVEKENYNARLDLAKKEVLAADEEITKITVTLNNAAGYDGNANLDSATSFYKNHTASKTVQQDLDMWSELQNKKDRAQAQVDDIQAGLNQIIAQLEQIEATQKRYLNLINAVEIAFYKKYAPFIREGSWEDDNYYDDNLYYIDGMALAYRSARPQVSYDISVVRLSGMEEFQSKVFHLGDRSYIEDVEFFGTTDGVTPYKEEVVISEITSYFDDPSKDTFKVQNFKTAYDDLFQRVRAATQSLQYHEGDYARAANAIEERGLIRADILQSTLNNNKSLVISATNNIVEQSSDGITLSDANDPSRKVRINASGVFITTDGGTKWTNAINSKGVSTTALTAGSINANEISIYQGNDPTFRWDTYGLTAFKWTKNSGGQITPTYNQFVRFDKYGLYGVQGFDGSGGTTNPWDPDTGDTNNVKGTDYIKKYGSFGLTWDGFFLKSWILGTDNPSATSNITFEISNENDIAIMYTPNTGSTTIHDIVKIGRLGDGTSWSKYGIRICDTQGNVVFEADQSGKLTINGEFNQSHDNVIKLDFSHFTLAYDWPMVTDDAEQGVINFGDQSITIRSRSGEIGHNPTYSDAITLTPSGITTIGSISAGGSISGGSISASGSIMGSGLISGTAQNNLTLGSSGITQTINGITTTWEPWSSGGGGWTPPDGVSFSDDSLTLGRQSVYSYSGYLGLINSDSGYTSVSLSGSGGSITATSLTIDYISSFYIQETSFSSSGIDYSPDSGDGSSSGISLYQNGSGHACGSLNGTWYGSLISGSDSAIKLNQSLLLPEYDTFFDHLIPRMYQLITGTSGRYHTGFIAQEVKQALDVAGLSTLQFAAYCDSAALRAGKSELGLRYDEFIALNTSQIQKLKLRVAALEARISQLEHQ